MPHIVVKTDMESLTVENFFVGSQVKGNEVELKQRSTNDDQEDFPIVVRRVSMTGSSIRKLLAAAGIAGFSMAATLPIAVQAQCTAEATACNPCAAASNPCATVFLNPCAAAACNPCAAVVCNPCAVAACNPCAVSNGYNPCKTCWSAP